MPSLQLISAAHLPFSAFSQSILGNDKAPLVAFTVPHVIKFTPPFRRFTSADDQLDPVQLEKHPILDTIKGMRDKENGGK